MDLYFLKVNKQQIINNNLNEHDFEDLNFNADFPENAVVQANDSSDVSTNIVDDTEASDDNSEQSVNIDLRTIKTAKQTFIPSSKKRRIMHLYYKGKFDEANVLIKVFYNPNLNL